MRSPTSSPTSRRSSASRCASRSPARLVLALVRGERPAAAPAAPRDHALLALQGSVPLRRVVRLRLPRRALRRLGPGRGRLFGVAAARRHRRAAALPGAGQRALPRRRRARPGRHRPHLLARAAAPRPATAGARPAMAADARRGAALGDRRADGEPEPPPRPRPPAGDGLGHALRRRRRGDRRPRARSQRRHADRAELVDLAALPRRSPARC